MKKLAVIGANAPLSPYYKRAKELGYYIIGIAWEEGAVCKEFCDKFYPISFADRDDVLRVCQEEQIDGITSFSLESALPTVSYIAQSMGLVGNTKECIERSFTKYAQRCSFQEAGLLVPWYYLVHSTSEAERLDIEFPAIVKPIDSGGKRGVRKIDSKEELLGAVNGALALSASKGVMIEQYIEGREFSVEYISYQGKHYFVQLTDKVNSGIPYFVEMEHHQPANVPLKVAEQIQVTVERALSALKIENSASHTEIKLTRDNQLYIIEIGARMGGDHITSDLVPLSTGYDFTKGVIDLALGDFVPPIMKTIRNAGIYYYTVNTPYIKPYIVNADEYSEIVQTKMYKTPLPLELTCNAQRNGYIIYQGDKKFEL